MRECPKCQGSMSDGFIVDQHYGSASVSLYQKGEPARSFWTGVKQTKKDQIEISTYRCERCGFLESYAPNP